MNHNSQVFDIINHPEKIKLKAQRYLLTGKITYYFGLMVHLFWCILFFTLDAPLLAAFNIFSILIFFFNIRLNKKGHFLTAATIATIEVVLHQVLCIIFIGWEAGFQYYLFLIILIPFLTDSKKLIFKLFLVLGCLITFLNIEYIFKDFPPIYTLSETTINTLNITNITFSMFVIALIAYYFNNSVNIAEEALELEQERADKLLHNILPKSIANRLINEDKTIADGFDCVSVLFLDIVGFTKLSASKPPEELVNILNEIFTKFDDLSDEHNLEKIKTIGDSYMVASGIPEKTGDHAERIADFALKLNSELDKINKQTGNSFKIRTGINSGPVVAGVIGKKKFIYDLWGDAVNVASRMESHGKVGEVQISESTYQLIKDLYSFESRGEIEIKGKGLMKTYLLGTKL
jgi:adenylate cyclase